MAHAKRILTAGYSMAEATGCIRWLDQEDWSADKQWTLAYVARKMPEYRQMMQRQKEQGQETSHRIGDVKL